jgi:excinuclease UvrABC helicase subunit UvrB
MKAFKVVAPFDVSGDQGRAVDSLVKGVDAGGRFLTLKASRDRGKPSQWPR